MQKLKKILLNDSSGSALIMAVVFCAVFLIMGTGTIKLISRGNELYTRDVKVIKSFWANESAMRIATRFLTRANPHPQDIANLNVGDDIIDINGFKPTVFIDNQGSNSYQITTNTMVDNLKNETTVSQISFNSFVRYTWFQEGTNANWKGYVVNGNFHSNQRLLISSSMTDEAHVIPPGEATCASDYLNEYPDVLEYGIGLKLSGTIQDYDWFHKRIPKYTGGVDPISTVNLAPETGAFDHGWSIESNTSTNYEKYLVELMVEGVNGKVNIYGSTSSNEWQSVIKKKKLSDIDTGTQYGGIIKSNANVHIAGTLKGQLTIVSGAGKDIVLAGNILNYDVTQGIPLKDSEDMLGIVSGNDIIIRDNYNLYNNDPVLDKNKFPEFDWNSENNILSVYASLFASNGCLYPNPSPYNSNGEWVGWNWQNTGNRVKVYGSYLRYFGETTFNGAENNWRGFIVNATGDPRYIDNLAQPPGIPTPAGEDREMREHWKVPLAVSYPFSVPLTWDNYMVKL